MRLIVAAVATLGVLPGAAGAANPEGAAPYAGAQQHNGLAGHLPPQKQNMEVVGKVELTGAFGDVQPEQIADVTVHKGFGYVSSWRIRGSEDEQCRGGFFVVDLRDPAKPKEVGFHPALDGSYNTEGMHARSIRTAKFDGDLLAVSNEHQMSSTSPECIPSDATQGGFDLWDVSDPANPKALVRGFGDPGADEAGIQRTNQYHSVFIWQDGGKAYAVAVDNNEESDVDVFDISDPAAPVQIGDWDLVAMFPQIASAMGFGNSAFLHDMVVKEVGGSQTMLLSYWDGGYVTLNVEDPANPTYVGDSDFPGPDPLLPAVDRPSGDAHYAEFSFDGRFILAADEDFSPYRFVPQITSGEWAGFEFAAGTADEPGARIEPGEELAGPTIHVGLSCSASPPAPTPGPETIAVAERGGCSFLEKAENADAAGYAGLIIFNSNTSNRGCETLLNMTVAGFDGDIPLLFVARSTGMRILGAYDEATYECTPGGTTTPAPPIGTTGADVEVANFFDGWGYTHLYRNAEGKLPQVEAWAVPESLDSRFSAGFGDLSVHEFATDPTEHLAYSAYYSAGMRVLTYGDEGLEQTGAYIDEGGSNFWGVEAYTAPDQQRYIVGSDRDYGVYVFRYTGPRAAQPPSCEDVSWWTNEGQATEVQLSCVDPNTHNVLKVSIDREPAHGTLSAVEGFKTTYTPKAGFTGVDTFTYTVNDGAASSAPAQVQIFVGGCARELIGTDARDLLNGTPAGDRIFGRKGGDTVEALQGDDCVSGEQGADQLAGGDGDDRLLGGGGGDRLFGEAGDDHLNGNGGRDHLRGSSGDDSLFGENGADYLSGGSNDDRISGGRGRDSIRGESGDDLLFGGAGPDSIHTGPGTDKVSGGGGRDRINAANGSRNIIRCGSGRDRVRADRNDRVARDCEVVRRTRR